MKSKSRTYRRRGSGYLLVMAAATLLSVIGLSSILLARVQQRSEDLMVHASRARAYARSGVEVALAYARADAAWRSQYTVAFSSTFLSLDRGGVSINITEVDGTSLATDSDNPVLITSSAVVGTTTSPLARQRVLVTASHPGLPLLRTALHCPTTVNVEGAQFTLTDGPVSCGSVFYNSGIVNGDVETRSLSNWGSIYGNVTTNAPARQMPATNVFDYFAAFPTVVTLPATAVGPTMEYVLLSPGVNPYSTTSTSADGLYYIKPSGDFRIRNDRIVGTLLVDLPAGRKLIVEQGMLWEPARPDFPSLLVRGSCEIRLDSTLYENFRTNFNPVSAPYQGTSDSDRSDLYDSLLEGVFHVVDSTSTLLLDLQTTVRGTVVSEGAVTIRGLVNLTADANLVLTSPMKYRCSYLQVVPGTWRE